MSDASYDKFVDTTPAVFAELHRIFAPGKVRVVFDIGSCEGEDSLRYARLFPHAKIFAVEPLSANQAHIRHHLTRHRADRCELVPLAFSDREGFAELHVSSGAPDEKFSGDDWNYGNKSSSLLPPGLVGSHWLTWLQFNKTETVSTTTLDLFCTRRGIPAIDYAHIDVQGAEGLVLDGASAMLPRITALFLEVADAEVYKGQKLRAEIDAWLRARGFRRVWEDNREIESDVLYVNLRRTAGLRRWLGFQLRNAARAARNLLKRPLEHPSP